MATVNGMTAEAMQAIADDSIVEGEVSGGDLILTTRGGTPINAGSVIGPTGPAGADGTNGTNGAQGPAGPTNMVGAPVTVNTSTPALITSGLVPGLVRNNVPVVAGNTYGINLDMTFEWSSLDVDAEWHIWVRLNGVNLERIALLKPVSLGITYQPAKGQIFWVAPTTQSTDDFEIYAQEVIDGANITPNGASTNKRKLWIIDYGVQV